MKKTLVFMASALFVALMAVSCIDNPAEAEEDQNAEATVEEVEETPAAEATTAAPANEAIDFNAYLDEYERLVVSYEELAENGGIDKAKEVKTNAEAAKAKIKTENLDDAQLDRFNKLNQRMLVASEKIAKKTAEAGKEAVNTGKEVAGKLGIGKKN